MGSDMLQAPLLGLGDEEEADLADWNLPLAFMKKRHCEKIEGSKSLAQSWRMKDRVSVSAPAAPGTGGFPAQGAQSREHVLGPRGVFSRPRCAKTPGFGRKCKGCFA